MSDKKDCPVGCGHPPDDHEDGRCMHLCDCAWPTAEKDAARVPCGCRIYDVGSPYICPTHYRPPRITPPDLTTELADRLVDRANELLDEGSSDAAE